MFVADRVAVEWGWFGVLHATLNLIRAAVASGHSFRYFTVLSGSDCFLLPSILPAVAHSVHLVKRKRALLESNQTPCPMVYFMDEIRKRRSAGASRLPDN